MGSDLPFAVPGGPVGAVDLDDVEAVVTQVAGEPGAVGAGSFDTEGTDVAEPCGPVVELVVADGRGRYLEVAESAAQGVERNSDVDVFVGVDADRDDRDGVDGDVGFGGGHAGDGLLLTGRLLAGGYGSPPVGRADTTATRPLRATLL